MDSSSSNKLSRNHDSWNSWKSMSAAEKALFLAKAKDLYQVKIDELTQIRGEEDWNVDISFDLIAFFDYFSYEEFYEVTQVPKVKHLTWKALSGDLTKE